MDKKHEDETLAHWQLRVFETEELENHKRACREKGRNCNFECPTPGCRLHPEFELYDKPLIH